MIRHSRVEVATKLAQANDLAMQEKLPTKAERERAERAKRRSRRAVINIEKELLALEKALPEWADVTLEDVGGDPFRTPAKANAVFHGGRPRAAARKNQ
jgi:hypothetical protein